MKKFIPLDHKFFRRKLKISQLDFKTTEDITSLTEFVGQDRALHALNFGIGIKRLGYNLYAMGPSGIGKLSLVSTVLTKHASKCTKPPDWCYVHNFETPEKPIALSLPTGLGCRLQQDMKLLVDELSVSILTVFEGDEYRANLKRINDHFDKRRRHFRKKNSNSKIDKTPLLYKEQHKKEKELELNSVTVVVKPIINKLRKKYRKFPEVLKYLFAVEKDIIAHVNDFIKQDEKTNLLTFSLENPALTKYKVNLFIDNSHLKGAPVIFEEAPSFSTLICRVEHITYLGSLDTNFTLIKPGALHRANGGYLLIEARKLRKNREAWEALKRALYTRKIKIKPIEHDSDTVKPISLEPMSIPLDIKIILLGDRNTYYSLCQNDPDFIELFKVAADFDEQIERNQTNVNLYARLIATITRRQKLKPFHVGAVAEVIDYSSRLAEDSEKLSTHIRDIQDLLIEADHCAYLKNKIIVNREDIKNAIAAQIHRMDRARELYYEDIQRDFIIINTHGKSIGQVNCLSVRRVGNFSYGHPTRVTARVRLGKGKFIDIQREIKMSGPMHSKAGIIISNFLASRFNQSHPFSLSASLSFEQIYCWTEGDSASVGELCALLSALAEIPIQQSLAITGSIDQYGEVQAIGGVNEKIEGFFDVCKNKGFTGKHGVLIPAVNVKNLMLREDILAAAKAKQFFLYPIRHIDEAITLLTGISAGQRNAAGHFPKASVNYKIEKRLFELAKNRFKTLKK